jgi:glycerol kinase
VSNASRTLLMNIHTLSWDADLCAAFGVPLRMLPSIVPSVSGDAYGVCGPDSVLPGVRVAGAVLVGLRHCPQ